MLKTNSLPPAVQQIVNHKATEPPFQGIYDDFTQLGTYLCRQCGLGLFRATTKFHSGCGWPSFVEQIAGSVKQQPDLDGQRTEIVCACCAAHLGHLFLGEGFTAHNTRYCVNSLSLDFVAHSTILTTEEAIVAAGCFWGVDYYFKKLSGVLKTEAGYTGGQVDNPNYEQICQGHTGHVEAVRVIYDPQQLTYANLIKYFFEIHDPTQANGQGPDLGEQYLSIIFAYDNQQENTAKVLISQLQQQGSAVITQVLTVSPFWCAEDYHQAYYAKTGKTPYCHRYVKRF